jgi:hypothetical protein
MRRAISRVVGHQQAGELADDVLDLRPAVLRALGQLEGHLLGVEPADVVDELEAFRLGVAVVGHLGDEGLTFGARGDHTALHGDAQVDPRRGAGGRGGDGEAGCGDQRGCAEASREATDELEHEPPIRNGLSVLIDGERYRGQLTFAAP